jgi:uncharacterized protein YukE
MTRAAEAPQNARSRPPYPEQQDAMIRKVAQQVEFHDVLTVLDTVKNQLLGNAERVEQIAREWGADQTMNSGKQELGAMKDKLAAYWSGPANSAFTSYTDSVVTTLDENRALIGTVATTLGSAVSTVWNTYAAAIAFIGKCFANLVALGAHTALFVATVEVPGLNLLTAGEWINSVIETLKTFIQDVSDLIQSATETIGAYKENGVALASTAGQFQVPQAPPGEAGQPGLWHVNPRNPEG